MTSGFRALNIGTAMQWHRGDGQLQCLAVESVWDAALLCSLHGTTCITYFACK